MGSQYAEWSQYTTYAVDAVVQYAGQIYVATAVNQNVVPYPPNATWTNISPVNPGILAGYVKNPMDAPLQCYNPSTTVHYSIDDAAYVSANEVRTDQISLVPGSLQNAVRVNDNIEMRTGTEIRAEHDLVFRTTGAWDYKMFNIRSGSQPVMLAYDPATGIVNQQPYTPGGGGTLVGVGAGTAITVDNTNPVFPVVNNDGVRTVNSEKGALTVAAGSGIGVATAGGTITISNTAPSSGGTLTGVGAGTGVLVDNTVPTVPVVSNDGVLTVNSAKGAVSVSAGSGIGVSTVGGNITISNTSPSSGGTLTGVGAGTGITVDNTVPTVPVVANDGVLAVNTAKGSLTVAAGSGIGVATVGNTITISNTSPSSGGTLTGVGAGTNIAVDNTNPAVPVVSVSVGSDLNMNTKSITNGGGATFASTVNAGAVSATNQIQGSSIVANTGGVQATAGGMTAVAGNITAQTGNISATVGDITAGGNISTSTGTVSANTITGIAGGVKSYAGLNLNPSGNPGSESDITGAGTVNVATTVKIGEALSYVDSGAVVAAKTGNNFYQGVLVQNKSATDHASANVVAVNDSAGTDYVAMGINSSAFGNLYDSLFEIPNASYVSGTADTVVGSQSDHSGTSALYLTYNSGAGAYCIDATGALSMNASRPGGLLNKGSFGTSGQVLTSAGSSAPPTWTTPASASDWSAYAATQNVDMATFDIDNAGAIAATSVSTTDFITATTTITGADVVASNSLSVNGLSVKPTLDFVATNELFVAKNGNDTTGLGSSLQPFATIQKAITTAQTITPKTGVCVIQIANGTYNETITISGANSGWIQLNGQSTSQNNSFGVVVRGSILIDMSLGVDDLISRQVVFSGLQLDATITNTSTKAHTVGIQNCRFYPSAASNGGIINDSATQNRVLIDNCEYTNDFPSGTPAPCFDFAGGSTVSFSKCDIQSTNNSSIIRLGGTSYFQRLENCYIQSQFNSPTLPLVNITSTSSTTHSIGLNIFSIATGSGITTPAIITANGGTIYLASNNFSLAGTNPSTGNVIQYAGTAPTLIYGNNTAVPLYASGIQSGITLVPFTDVGSTAGKFTSINTGSLTSTGAISGTSITGTSLSSSGGTITGGAITGTSVSAGSGTISTSGAINGGAITGTSVSAGSGTISTSGAINGGAITGTSLAAGSGAITGATLTTTGAIKSSGTLQISGNTVSNASNTTALTGVNSITMAGTAPSISGADSISITNTTAAIPLDILNSGDNPQVRIRNAAVSTTVPVEFNWVNGTITLAMGQQATDARGAFVFFNGKDVLRTTTTTPRLQLTYSPYTPTLASSGASGAWVAGTGAFTSGVPKLLGTQTITLSAANFPIIQGGFGTEAYVGLNGFINTAILTAASHRISVSVSYTRTRSGVLTPPVGQYALYGAAYPLTTNSDGSFYAPVNGVSYNETTPAQNTTFTLGDVLTLYVYGLYTGGSPPSIITPASGLAAVLSPFFL